MKRTDILADAFLDELEKIAGSALRKRLKVVADKIVRPNPTGNYMIRYRLMLHGSPVAIMRGVRTPQGFQAKELLAVRGHRMGQKLHGEVLKREGKILSDYQMSEPALKLYQRMGKTPKVRVKQLAPTQSVGEDAAWGGRFQSTSAGPHTPGLPMFSVERMYPAQPTFQPAEIRRLSVGGATVPEMPGYHPRQLYRLSKRKPVLP